MTEHRQRGLESYAAGEIRFVRGVIPETFAAFDRTTIAFAHVDLDLYAPIKAACAFIFPRLLVGGAMVFDDYGWASCPGPCKAVDDYFADRPESVLVLPTGQACVVKLRR